MARAKMSDPAERAAEHIEALSACDGLTGQPRRYMAFLAEREARAILEETERGCIGSGMMPGFALWHDVPVRLALIESLAAFVA
jgi:hypothetical protein